MISRRLLRIKILQVLYAHRISHDSDNAELAHLEGVLDFSIQKAYELYYYLLLLTIAVRRYAETRIELAKNKNLPTHEDLHPNTRFIDNEVIQQLQSSQSFHAYLSQHKLSWVNHPELVKHLYLSLTASDYYKQYMDDDIGNYEKDKELLINFFTNELEHNDLLSQIMEEQSVFWNDDMDFAVTFVVKTIKGMHSGKDVPIAPMYKSEDDKIFAHELLLATVKNYDEYGKLIEKHAENWDIERIALTDKLIIQMAINELIEFPFIPINVTFDEYIELPKSYSTPKSSVFINGLLDKISEELTKEGKITKLGRGLIEE
ncbi:MAG: transcription antitermination factor NusB [Bacteroidales bacterium]|jgi:N utilization substance protein B|nr:transcription antitermination factor NusB [Bacteroidales bacterium]